MQLHHLHFGIRKLVEERAKEQGFLSPSRFSQEGSTDKEVMAHITQSLTGSMIILEWFLKCPMTTILLNLIKAEVVHIFLKCMIQGSEAGIHIGLKHVHGKAIRFVFHRS
uniref:Uncharacterized protein n=1 Tax=Rhizophora mucronata TaxID=61149 RepID=A0A2P2JDL0_RHIMU